MSIFNNNLFYWGMVAVWLLLYVAIPNQKRWKGHFWRTFRKLPIARAIRPDHMLWLSYWFTLVLISCVFAYSLPFVLDSIRIIDDWLNADDDDYRKKWERLKNKVKWRKFQPSPIKQPVTCHR